MKFAQWCQRGNSWYLSTRKIRSINDPEWTGYINFIGLNHLTEVRTIDSWCNPYVDGSGILVFESLAEALEQTYIDSCELPYPTSEREYYQLFADALTTETPQFHPRIKLLGYDLSDETWTSSLLNCGRWEGILAPIAQRVNQYGLLDLKDAKTAQILLPQAWSNTDHSRVTIWAILEVQPIFEIQS